MSFASAASSAGVLSLAINYFPAPINDDFASRVNLTPTFGITQYYSTLAASLETGEPTGAAALPAASVWFTFTPDATQRTLFITTYGSSFG